MQKKSFREDINGLRAIAVLSVLLFHFKSSYLPGGFAGVDVFFVISGFLMTSIIFRGIESNTFSIIEFLKSRAKRIVPALMLVIGIVLAVGYVAFDPSSYKIVGKHAVASLLFISNIIYNRESGYFDVDSHDKLFLHTWSLSVEWQFYIIYPIVLVVLSKIISTENIKKIIWVSFFVFLLISIYESSTNKSSSYFLLYSRAWEMIIGGIAYIYPLNNKIKHRRIIEIIGISLIIISFFVFSSSSIWPGYNALLPVVGAYVCILSNNKKSILSFKPIQYIGLWSYSIYLFHWPVMVVMNKFNITMSLSLYLLLTISISFLSYQLIEKKRDYSFISVIVYILLLSLSFFIFKNGFINRTGDNHIINFHNEFYGGTGIPDSSEITRFNTNKDVKFILVGDSLSRQYANFLKSKNIGFVGIFQNGCFSTEGFYDVYDERYSKKCISRYKNLLKAINEYKDADIIVAQRWDDKVNLKYIDSGTAVDKGMVLKIINDYIGSISSKATRNRDVYLIGLIQGTKKNVFECQQKNKLPIYRLIGKSNCSERDGERLVPINKKIDDMSNTFSNVSFIDINKFICSDGKCSVTDNFGNPIYSDGRHLSTYGAEFIGEEILNVINNTRKHKNEDK